MVNISLIASLALSQSLAAVTLPSGGKFVNGTGSITINGNTMEITGKDTNHVIAWGGGFNIGKGYTVDFTTGYKNYLNLDYTNKASQILGTLNGRTNNVYVVNPSGVLIGEGATINAHKFGVSTTPMNMTAIDDFLDNGSFSPAFNANKGDVVNMGTINANKIVLVGNKVENLSGKLQGKDQDFADQVTIEGNKVYLEGVGIKATNLDATINEGGYFTHDTGILYDAYVDKKQLNYRFDGNAVDKGDFKKFLYIGSKYANNNQMINSWKGFAGLVNEGVFESIGFDDVYLGNDISFNGELIDSVGEFATFFDPSDPGNKPFSGNFYGNGYTLSNLLINAEGKKSAGLFGYINGGSVQDLTIDGLNFQGSASYMGGLAGYINTVDMINGIKNGNFSNIALNNIGDISSSDNYAGGFAGYINTGDIEKGFFSNIALENIGNISGSNAGGFAGYVGYGNFSNIALENIGNISSSDNYAGGFAGQIEGSTLSNIALENIGNISGSNAGGFAGWIAGGSTLSNIALNNIGDISGDGNDNYSEIKAGGFAGSIGNAEISNVVLNNIGKISGTGGSNNFTIKAGGFAGHINDATLSNITLNTIGDISSSSGGGGGSYAGGFAGEIDNATLSNITLNTIGSISSSGGFAGGFAGRINSGTYSNIVINTINRKDSEGEVAIKADSTPAANAGGFAGSIEYAKISNVVLSDIQGIKANSGSNNSYAGGFAGSITDGIFSNIALNNIDSAQANGKVGYISAGGFAGYIKKGDFSNIVLNDIRSIIAEANMAYAYAGGFAGKIGDMRLEGGRFSNIVLNNMFNIYSEQSASSIDHVPYAGGFAGYIEKGDFSNIVLNSMYIKAYNRGPTKYTGVFLGIGSTYTAEKIYSYGVLGSSLNQTGIEHPNSIALDLTQLNDLQTLQDNSGISGLEYHEMQDEDGILYPYLHMVTNGNVGGEDSEITFDGGSFTYNASNNTPNIPEINPDGSGTSPLPEVPNEGKLSSVDLKEGDFEEEILKIIINDILNNEYVLNIDDIDFKKFNEDDLAIILYLLKNTADEALKESIRQSLDFYTEFNKGETDGLKSKFKEWYGTDSSSTYSISMDKYESIERLKEYVNGTLKPELESIRNNLNRFESLKAEIERLAKVYQEALDNNLLPYEQLEIIYKDTQEKIDAYYAEAKDLLETLHGDNKPFLVKLFEEKYNFSEIYKDNSLTTGSFSFVGSNVDGSLDYKGSLIGKEVEDSALGDKPILSLPGNENSGDDQTINRGEGAEIAKTLAKQADLASGESVIVLPAEETQSVIDEGERELGRVCIVSDNAKTSNPCIAIAF
ncbi:TPA: filamentous hemagglutinin N-terminal domain-containing protein [Campylobacter coli]|nr:filamentous hemagglutinin N-terminal domain-containing protein [Campylobacter coli]